MASEKYYRDMVDPTYTKIRSQLMNKMKSDTQSPPVLSMGIDGWSQFHEGYMGMNCHYLDNDWNRVIFNLACAPFDEKHTGENIYRVVKSVLQEWDIFEAIKEGLSLRDNASNMIAAFKQDGGALKSVGCLNHSLQLVIKDGLFTQISVKTVIERARRLVTYANHSDKFYAQFYKQQRDIMGITNRRSLKQDVPTR